MEEEPGRQLHQLRGEAHALGGRSISRNASELLGFGPARTVEIGRGFFHQRHTVTEQIGENLGVGETLAERHRLHRTQGILGHDADASLYTGLLRARKRLGKHRLLVVPCPDRQPQTLQHSCLESLRARGLVRAALTQNGTKKSRRCRRLKGDNREASNRVDRSHSMSMKMDVTSNERESLTTA